MNHERQQTNGLPAGWVWTTIGEISRVNRRDPALRDLHDDLPVTFLPMSAVDALSGTIAAPEVRRLADVRKGLSPFSEGDVLFAKITPSMENGKAAIATGLINGRGFGSTEFHVLSPDDFVLAQWLFYFVRQESFRADAKASFTGTAGQLRVPAKFLEESKIPLPPLPEQHRIVAEIETQFTRLDAGVAALKQVQVKLRRYKASVLKAACEGRLVPTEAALARVEGREFETGAALLARILAERRVRWEQANPGKRYVEPKGVDGAGLADLPEGWVWATINQLSEVATGATPLREQAKYWEAGTIAWVTSGALNELFVREPSELITIVALHETSAKVFPPGTLLVAMYGEGKTRGKVSELLISAATNQACAALLFGDAGPVIQPWIKLFLQKNYEDIRRLSSGGVQPNLNLGIIKSTVLPLPPLPEQHRIVAEVERRLSVAQEVESTVAAGLRRAERLRQSILKQAFTGRLTSRDVVGA